MAQKLNALASCICICIVSGVASAEVVFTDATADEASGNSNLDLTQVSIDNDNTSLTIAVTVNHLHSDWGKHMVFINTGAAGHTGTSNPWFRNVDHGGNEISHFIGTWLDGGGGAEMSRYNAGSDSWDNNSTQNLAINWADNTFTYTIALADLGIGIGNTIRFDVASTGGGNGDPSTDHFSSGYHGNWGEGSSLGSDLMEYTVVPAPGALALLGIAGLITARRRRV